jgi:hypothetical protein
MYPLRCCSTLELCRKEADMSTVSRECEEREGILLKLCDGLLLGEVKKCC